MGENERCSESGGQLPNGLLPGAGSVVGPLEEEKWLKAEERTAELLACIQPNQQSEERRNAVADYVQRLIMKCFPCQVFKFGSVPLKTYLPDGDIDLTAFSHDQNLKESWAKQVRDMLKNEEKNENAEFHVKEVQYIQAEVKIIKCLVENIVVDISFNQVGGLCTLCFLDEVDNLINQNHLFKRSVILIKAWCYYESRILGAHHGLISTYALETLVLYIFHVFNNSFYGPLEVLYRFLDFFGNFDWENFCVSLWGPVPISSLPAVTADPPRKDDGELLLSKMFLDACSSVYAVFPGGQENNGQPFISKHFNVIDPLRENNNLGRSVSKGNFLRIRSAFTFGTKKMARLFDCPIENLTSEVNKFFTNTWERHGSSHRPDIAGGGFSQMRLSTSSVLHGSGNSNNLTGHNVVYNSHHNKEDKDIHSHGVFSQHSGIPAKLMARTSGQYAVSFMPYLKHQNLNSLQVSNNFGIPHDIQRDTKVDHLGNDTQGRILFPRTHSSPELSDAYGDVLSQKQSNRQPETTNAQGTSVRLDASNRKKNHRPESMGSYNDRPSFQDTSYVKHAPFQQGVDRTTIGSNYGLNSDQREFDLDALNEEFSSNSETHASMPASASLEGSDGQFRVPFNLKTPHLPFSIPPSFFASMGYGQLHLSGFFPSNIPLINPSFPDVQFPPGLISPQLTQYIHGYGVNSPSEASFEKINGNFDSVTNKSGGDNYFWNDQDVNSSTGYDHENSSFDADQTYDKPPAWVPGSKYVPPPRLISSASVMKVQQKHSREKHGSVQYSSNSFHVRDDRNGECYADERSSSSMFSSAALSNSKPTEEKRGKRTVLVNLPTSQGKGKVPEHLSKEDDDQELLSNMGTEVVERKGRSVPVASLQVPGNHMSVFQVAQTSERDSSTPFAPMLVDPGLGQKTDDSSGLVAFYPTGPPIPFLTMLPIYNIPSERGTSDASSGYFPVDETSKSSESVQRLSPAEFDNFEDLNLSSSLRGIAQNKTSDILNSDFASHWQNLQFGRFCQDPWNHGPLVYPSSVMVPPYYLQGRFPYDNPGRPISTNGNISQLMTNNGHRLVPLAPLQSVSGRPLNVYQQYTDDMPRYRSGTGTYLPNPVSVGDRHSSVTRKGNYNHDRNDNYGDREGRWNASSKARSTGRNHSRIQNDKSNFRADRLASAERPWSSYRHESIHSNPSQNGSLSSNSTSNVPQNVVYDMSPLGAHNPDIVSNGPSVPPVVMLYPCDHNATFGSHREPLEFGSLGPVDFPGVDEGKRSGILEDPRLQGSCRHQGETDQSSSSNPKRRI